MKKIFWLGLIVVGLMVAGVIQFQKDGDEVHISIDRAKLRRASSKLIDEGNQVIDKAQQRLNDRRRESVDFETEYEPESRSQTRRFTPSRYER
jgi:hypothetical protein